MNSLADKKFVDASDAKHDFFFNPKVDIIPDWLVAELTPFASGEHPWSVWDNWLALSGDKASRELDPKWFSRIKSNPQTEVLRFLTAAGISVTPYYRERERVDPLDENEHFTEILAEADRLALESVGPAADEMGGCHLVWKAKKQLLKEQFGLEWRSPSELNSHIMYD